MRTVPRYCSTCDTVKTTDDFYRWEQGPGGHAVRCKACEREVKRRYRKRKRLRERKERADSTRPFSSTRSIPQTALPRSTTDSLLPIGEDFDALMRQQAEDMDRDPSDPRPCWCGTPGELVQHGHPR
jgi:hypothetical protein